MATDPNVTITPNMSLPVPDLSDPGSDYAINVNECLETIDGHTHTGAPTDGLQLDLSTQLCEGDIQLNDNNLGTVRSVEFESQSSNLIGSQDVNCLCVVNNVLGFNNSSGTFVPLIAPTSTLLTNFTAITVTTNHTILATDTINLINCNQAAGLTITLPRANTILPTPQWRMYLIKDISGLTASTETITIQVAPASGDTFALTSDTSVTIATELGYLGVYTDGVGTWYVWDQSTYNEGDVLNINGGLLLFSGGGALAGTASPGPGFNFAGTTPWSSGGPQIQTGASLEMQSGSTLKVDAGSTINLDASITASASHAVSCGVATPTTPVSGTLTLSTTQYNSPIIELGTQTLSGDLTVAFPSIVGAIWYMDIGGLTLAGHSITVMVGSASQIISGTAANLFVIVCTAANAFVFK